MEWPYNGLIMISTVSITQLKQNITSVIKRVRTEGRPVVVLQRSEPAAVLLDPDYYKTLEETLEDFEDLKAIQERMDEPRIPIEKIIKKLASR